jgi:hypothetical protein
LSYTRSEGAGRECRVRLELDAGRWAGALAEALRPDNLVTPPGLSVECAPQDGLLVCIVEAGCDEPGRLLRLRNTVDDLLSSLRAALEALRAASGEA